MQEKISVDQELMTRLMHNVLLLRFLAQELLIEYIMTTLYNGVNFVSPSHTGFTFI